MHIHMLGLGFDQSAAGSWNDTKSRNDSFTQQPSDRVREKETTLQAPLFFSCCHFDENSVIANEKVVQSRVGSRLFSCRIARDCQRHAGRKQTGTFIFRAPT